MVVAVNQRDDGALTVSKIHAKEGKNEKDYISSLVLSPNNHKSLSTDSVVDKGIIWELGKKWNFPSIYPDHLKETNDNLTEKELKKEKEKKLT